MNIFFGCVGTIVGIGFLLMFGWNTVEILAIVLIAVGLDELFDTKNGKDAS